MAREKRAQIWERAEGDWYVEPEDVTTALLEQEQFAGGIWDPTCGQGNICRAALKAGYTRVFGTDLAERPGVKPSTWWKGRHDFLTLDWPKPLAPNIVANFPYGGGALVQTFIRRALEVAPSKVAAFVSLRFLMSETRATGFFQDTPPARIWMVTPRCSVPPGEFLLNGGKAGGGQADYCWLVYDIGALKAPPQLGWLVRKTGKAAKPA